MQHLVGQTLGQYELKSLLGEGGMGTVYRGYHAALKREVAIKVLLPQIISQPGALERFVREAQTAASLEHPHIVPIYDYGTQNGLSYVVMRLLTGGSLADRMAYRVEHNGALPTLAEVAQITRELADALDYAHQRNVIHRDIKPNNVMFNENGMSFLVDFGLARLSEASVGLTTQNTLLGTPMYMAPEQWQSAKVGPAADQYALGVIVYALLTGQTPFSGDTPFQLMHDHLYTPPPPILNLRGDLPKTVQDVLAKVLEKNPADRYGSVSEFARKLEEASQSLPPMEASGFFVINIASLSSMPIVTFTPPAIPQTANPVATTPMEAPITTRISHHRAAQLTWAGVAAMLLIFVALIWFLSNQNDENGGNAESNISASATPTDIPPSPTTTPSPTETSTVTPSPTNTLTAREIAQARLDAQQTETQLAQATLNEEATISFEMAAIAQETQMILALSATATFTATATSTSTSTPRPTRTATSTATPSATRTPIATPSPRVTPGLPICTISTEREDVPVRQDLRLEMPPITSLESGHDYPVRGQANDSTGQRWWLLAEDAIQNVNAPGLWVFSGDVEATPGCVQNIPIVPTPPPPPR